MNSLLNHAQAAARGDRDVAENEDKPAAPQELRNDVLHPPEFTSSRAALAFAERHVRTEDDVPSSELRFFTDLYARIARMAQRELMQPDTLSTSSDQLAAQRESEPLDMRSELLRARYEAFRWVLEEERRRPRRVLPGRKLAWIALACVAALGLGGRAAIMDAFELGVISRGKTWVASSTFSPGQATRGTLGDFSAPFFFHTAYEKQPWVEIDLGRDQRVSGGTIVNRPDCCGMRALPLVLELSRDRRTWQVQARRDHGFAEWHPRFWPKTARFVRLRVLRDSVLHLKSIALRW